MDKIRNAAIILIGLGDKCASDILKNMSPKEVRAILEAVNNMDGVTEADFANALNDFFKESENDFGFEFRSKEDMRNSIVTAVGNQGMSALMKGIDRDKEAWLELIKMQPVSGVVDLVQEEHPQIVTALIIIMFNYLSSEHGTKLIKALPKHLQSQVFKRMTGLGYMSKFAINTLAEFFQKELEASEKNNIITVDGLDTVANIISYLDSETEKQIMTDLSTDDKALGEKIQDKMFPFHRLGDLDKKSLQVLLKEIKNEDLILALKGVEERIKEVFMQNMSVKSAEILKDEMETKGPVKLVAVLDAQKRIIRLAKKLESEEKIILSAKNNPDIVF